ncbi:unnamed protein product [Closterium sp. NIES-54]
MLATILVSSFGMLQLSLCAQSLFTVLISGAHSPSPSSSSPLSRVTLHVGCANLNFSKTFADHFNRMQQHSLASWPITTTPRGEALGITRNGISSSSSSVGSSVRNTTRSTSGGGGGSGSTGDCSSTTTAATHSEAAGERQGEGGVEGAGKGDWEAEEEEQEEE